MVQFLLKAVAFLLLTSFVYSERALGDDRNASLIDFQNEYPSRITIAVGDIVSFGGSVASLVTENVTIALSVVSNATEGRDWVFYDRITPDILLLAPLESAKYEFAVRFLKPGVFLMQPTSTILESPDRQEPTDANFPDCSTCKASATIVLVQEYATVPSVPSTPSASIGFAFPIVIATIAAVVGVILMVFTKTRSKFGIGGPSPV